MPLEPRVSLEGKDTRAYVRNVDRSMAELSTEEVRRIDEFWTRQGISRIRVRSRLISLAQSRPLFRSIDGLEDKLEFLSRCLPDARIGRIVSRHPLLLEKSPETLEDCLIQLKDILPNANLSKVVERQPTILLRKTTTLQRNLQTLQDLLPACDVERMIERQPVLLFLDSGDSGNVARNIVSFKNLFPTSDVYRMLEREPSLLYQNFKRIEQNYMLLSDALPGVNTGHLLSIQPSLLYSDVKKRTVVNVSRLEKIFDRIARQCGEVNGISFADIVSVGSGTSLLTTKPETTESKLERIAKLVPKNVLCQWLHKPSTLARVLNASHAVLDRIEFMTLYKQCNSGFSSAITMTRQKFCQKYPDFPVWQEERTLNKT